MTSASHHLATCCSRTVLPVPKPPGTAAVLPRAMGNSRSSTRCPVSSGTVASSRSRTGRARRTGQDDSSGTGVPPTTATGSVAATGPAARSAVTGPAAPGGTRTRCGTEPAPCTVPSRAPASRSVPSATPGAGDQAHVRRVRSGPVVPGSSQVPAVASGRSSPSCTPPSRPGPRPADSGCPSRRTGAPGDRPPVYSYACVRARSPPRATTSPSSRSGPSSTSSDMAAPVRPSTSTRGPLTRTTRPLTAPTAAPPRGPAPRAGPRPGTRA